MAMEEAPAQSTPSAPLHITNARSRSWIMRQVAKIIPQQGNTRRNKTKEPREEFRFPVWQSSQCDLNYSSESDARMAVCSGGWGIDMF
jgi:hypothetical protein